MCRVISLLTGKILAKVNGKEITGYKEATSEKHAESLLEAVHFCPDLTRRHYYLILFEYKKVIMAIVQENERDL